MAPKKGTFLLLLPVACAAFVTMCSARSPCRDIPGPGHSPDMKYMAKRLIRKCQEKGYLLPKMNLLTTVFSNRSLGRSNNLLSTLMGFLDSLVSRSKGSPSRTAHDDKMANVTWNCSGLLSMIKRMRNFSEPSVCYMQAFVAPLAWTSLTTQSKYLDSDDGDTLLWASRPVLQQMSSTNMKLPINVPLHIVKKMMKMLLGMYMNWPENQRAKVTKWAKQQIMQNNFNCTTTPSSGTKSPKEYVKIVNREMIQPCSSSANWLDSEALNMMGPYISYVSPDDVESCPKEKLCEFFLGDQFKSATGTDTKMKPSLANMFLQRFRECVSGQEAFAEHMDKLGVLACYSYSAPNLTPDLSRKLLFQLSRCDNPRIRELKVRLVKTVMSHYNGTQTLRDLGSSFTLLSPEQVSMMPLEDIKQMEENVEMTQGQMYAVAKKKLGKMKCEQVAYKELMALRSIVGALPNCVLRRINGRELLNDPDAPRMFKQMRKHQLKAVLHRLSQDVEPSELVQKVDGELLRHIPLDTLAKANITSLDQVEKKTWRRSQACYLARKLRHLKQLHFRRLRSICQGVTCKMTDEAADSDVEDMAQALTETPQWLSKAQTGCLAQRLFSTLETKRAKFFTNVVREEMDAIPTMLFTHLPPAKVRDLPDSVCQAFLNKMQVSNLSSLPLHSPSRLALTERALLCLGRDISKLSTEDASRLGPLLCELKPSQLRLLTPDVLNFSLQAMASCQHIPQRHRAALIRLVTHTFGDTSEWSPETIEDLGPLILLDDKATAAIPNNPCVKDALYFLKQSHTSKALQRKIFVLSTTTSNTACTTIAANGNITNGSVTGTDGRRDIGTVKPRVPTVRLIRELEMANVWWTAEQFDQMSSETLIDTVEILGKIPDFSPEQLAALRTKATEAFGPVENLTESVVMQMGCIAQGFSNSDLRRLPFLLGTLDTIGHCGWNESQMVLVWKAVAFYNNLTAQRLGAEEMVALDRFICGLNSSEIRQLKLDAFMDAVGSLDGVHCSSINVTLELKSLAVLGFGDPSSWTEVQVSELGNVIAGLEAAELASLDPSVFSFISESCIPLIPQRNFASLSAAQMGALGPDNAAMVTSEQKAALTAEQQAALRWAMTGFRDHRQTSSLSGAPSPSVEGISAFVKPLLFLLTGFLLL